MVKPSQHDVMLPVTSAWRHR